ncbi:hypothetical protein [Halorubrum pallidum]|uniref:Uncharacterized protein n=1 Tax=Halorubrum pallidum TaxID=1526114 RepID=A0ABD5T4U0_9EURY
MTAADGPFARANELTTRHTRIRRAVPHNVMPAFPDQPLAVFTLLVELV